MSPHRNLLLWSLCPILHRHRLFLILFQRHQFLNPPRHRLFLNLLRPCGNPILCLLPLCHSRTPPFQLHQSQIQGLNPISIRERRICRVRSQIRCPVLEFLRVTSPSTRLPPFP